MELGCDNVFSKENYIRVRLEGVTFSALKLTPNILYKFLCDMLLNDENLFYFCSRRSSCRTLNDTRKYIKSLIKKNILSSELNTILVCMGWDKDSIDIYNTVFQGDLGEYMMSLIVERFEISKTLISKVSLKSSPKKAVSGNDNIYYDADNKVLYYGEAKFYSDTKKAVIQAYDSIQSHLSGVKEFYYVKNHSSDFIFGEKKVKRIEKFFETCSISDVKIKSIGFVMSDDDYEIIDYENDLNELKISKRLDLSFFDENILIFLPVISKEGFLKYFENEVNKI